MVERAKVTLGYTELGSKYCLFRFEQVTWVLAVVELEAKLSRLIIQTKIKYFFFTDYDWGFSVEN